MTAAEITKALGVNARETLELEKQRTASTDKEQREKLQARIDRKYKEREALRKRLKLIKPYK